MAKSPMLVALAPDVTAYRKMREVLDAKSVQYLSSEFALRIRIMTLAAVDDELRKLFDAEGFQVHIE